jgi:DNA-binding NarL/FixJ family response regulator
MAGRRRFSPAQPTAVPQMNTATRDALIVTLRRRGLTHAEIGRRVGLSDRGVAAALRRIADGRPGRVRG